LPDLTNTIENTDPDLSVQAARNWTKILSEYRDLSRLRSIVEISITILPFALLWTAMWLLLDYSYWLSLLLAVPTAGFLVRLFIIQHDCGHGTFFHKRATNDWVGRVIGVLTLTPYDYWRRTHANHHATCGNLDRRGMGDVTTLTLQEYQASSMLSRFWYRVYRHPLVLFALGPAYLYFVQQRLPVGLMRDGWKPWLSTMSTNVGILVTFSLLIWGMGLQAFLMVHVPIVALAASFGVWLFYVQHQFEDTLWDDDADWDLHEAALHGSSHYDLPAVLRWFTGNIGMHHVHHLCSQIPFYRLPRTLRDYPALTQVNRVTLIESLRYVKFALWDESQRRMISFRDARSKA
jgi:acyl-lipid omega-6 desaturase (Delta-12 desaturase)